MARTVSTTKASTAKSTPPKKGTDAQIQRMNNTIKSLFNSGLGRGVIGTMYRNALKNLDGSARVSNADAKAMKNAKPAPKEYQGKAYGGKAKKKK